MTTLLESNRYDVPLNPDVKKALEAFAKGYPSDNVLKLAIEAGRIGRVEDWLTDQLETIEISPADALSLIENGEAPELRERLAQMVPAEQLLEQLQANYRAHCLQMRREELLFMKIEVTSRASRFQRTSFWPSVTIGRGRLQELIASELSYIGWGVGAFYWSRDHITLRNPRRPSEKITKAIVIAIKQAAFKAAAELGTEERTAA